MSEKYPDRPATDSHSVIYDFHYKGEALGRIEVNFVDTHMISKVIPRVKAFMKKCVEEYQE